MNRKGFTLIELLVVIAVLAVLAAGVIVAINPAKRINQANDAKIKNDIGQITTAMQAYYTSSPTHVYPASVAALVTNGDLKNEPKTPAGAVYTVRLALAGSCASGVAGCEVAVGAALNDPLAANNVWCWRSSTQVATESAAAACIAP